MKNFKAKHPWWYRIIVATLIVAFFNGITFVSNQTTKSNQAKEEEQAYRQQLIDGCLKTSQSPDYTEAERQGHCGCVADGFVQLFPPSGIPPTKEVADNDPRIESMGMECYRKNVAQN
jgi:hypothetical protein